MQSKFNIKLQTPKQMTDLNNARITCTGWLCANTNLKLICLVRGTLKFCIQNCHYNINKEDTFTSYQLGYEDGWLAW